MSIPNYTQQPLLNAHRNILSNNIGILPGTASIPPPPPTGPQVPSHNNVLINTNSNIDVAKIFVGGLSWQTTEETLRYHFEQYGEVVSVEIMKDRNTGDPRGFAFVVFRSDDTVQLILNEKPHEIDRKIVDVKRAQARGFAPPSIHPNASATPHLNLPSNSSLPFGNSNTKFVSQNPAGTANSNVTGIPPTSTGNAVITNNTTTITNNSTKIITDHTNNVEINKVFVGGLPLHYTREELTQELSRFGEIIDSIVMMDPIQRTRSRGFGFVTFSSPDSAKECIRNQPINMAGKMVEIKLATPRGGNNNAGSSGNSDNYHGNPLHINNNKNGVNSNSNDLKTQSSSSTTPSLPPYMSQQKLIPPPPPPPKGKYAGLAASYGRNGWRAGYGTSAFGGLGWNVAGWEQYSINEFDNQQPSSIEKLQSDEGGFSFSYLSDNEETVNSQNIDESHGDNEHQPESKRAKYS